MKKKSKKMDQYITEEVDDTAPRRDPTAPEEDNE